MLAPRARISWLTLERFGEAKDVAADVFDLLGVLGLDGDVPVGDEPAEVQSGLGAVLVGGVDGSAGLGGPVGLALLVERGEKFAGRRHGERCRAT